MRTLSDITSSLPDYDPNGVSVDRAQQIIRDFVVPIHSVEKVSMRNALQRVLAADVISPIDVPAHDNSAMDGYAIRSADLTQSVPLTLKVAGSAYAGQAFSGPVGPGECVQIMTGAVMPEGCDTVIPQELTTNAAHDLITIPVGAVSKGDNRRFRGEDLAAGMPALFKGRVLLPSDLGLLASLGLAEVTVQRRLRIAFFSTGNELRSIGETLDEGSVYDSNRYTLHGMLTRLGCDMIDMGVVRDEPDLLEAAFREACENADAVITSGGVSVGAADYTKQIMSRLGDMTFWQIGMRPGRPMAFGKISSGGKSAYVFGLPGNPVAVMVTFYFFVRDALLHMMGANPSPVPLMRVISESTIRKKTGRTEYQRGILFDSGSGQWKVRITGSQGSGILRSMSEANCMVILHPDQGSVQEGDQVDVVVFEGLV
jgi:molybdopterin molybdotransferase